jgi:hypothetical protein
LFYAFFSSHADTNRAWNEFLTTGFDYSTYKAARKKCPALLPIFEIGKHDHICIEELNMIKYLNARDELLKVICMKKDRSNIRMLMVVFECFNQAFYNISEVRISNREMWIWRLTMTVIVWDSLHIISLKILRIGYQLHKLFLGKFVLNSLCC